MHAESDLNTSPESFAESDLKASLNQTSTNTGIDSASNTGSKKGVFCGQLHKQPAKCPPGGVMPPCSLKHPPQPVLQQAAKRLRRVAKAVLLGNEGGGQGKGTWCLPSLNNGEHQGHLGTQPQPHSDPASAGKCHASPQAGRDKRSVMPLAGAAASIKTALRPTTPHNPRRGVRGNCGGCLYRPEKQFCLFTPKRKHEMPQLTSEIFNTPTGGNMASQYNPHQHTTGNIFFRITRERRTAWGYHQELGKPAWMNATRSGFFESGVFVYPTVTASIVAAREAAERIGLIAQIELTPVARRALVLEISTGA
jgi:hypothetical protein